MPFSEPTANADATTPTPPSLQVRVASAIDTLKWLCKPATVALMRGGRYNEVTDAIERLRNAYPCPDTEMTDTGQSHDSRSPLSGSTESKRKSTPKANRLSSVTSSDDNAAAPTPPASEHGTPTIASARVEPPQPSFAVGDLVEGNYRNLGGWYSGVITKVRISGTGTRPYETRTFDLAYHDGDHERSVPERRIRALSTGLAGKSDNGAAMDVASLPGAASAANVVPVGATVRVWETRKNLPAALRELCTFNSQGMSDDWDVHETRKRKPVDLYEAGPALTARSIDRHHTTSSPVGRRGRGRGGGGAGRSAGGGRGRGGGRGASSDGQGAVCKRKKSESGDSVASMTSPPPPSPGAVEPPNAPNVRNDDGLHPLEDGPSDMEEEEEEQAETPARISTHHNFTLEKIACPMCGKVYKRGHGIKLHFRRIHGARIDDDMLFGVSDGTAASTSPPNPRPTVGDSVPREGHFVCCMCSEVFGRAEDLQEHERVHAKATSPSVHAAGLSSVKPESSTRTHDASPSAAPAVVKSPPASAMSATASTAVQPTRPAVTVNKDALNSFASRFNKLVGGSTPASQDSGTTAPSITAASTAASSAVGTSASKATSTAAGTVASAAAGTAVREVSRAVVLEGPPTALAAPDGNKPAGDAARPTITPTDFVASRLQAYAQEDNQAATNPPPRALPVT